MQNESVTTKATKAVKWSALMEIVSRSASPIIFVVIARLLAPSDFGVVATAMIAISFSQMFWDAGLSKALIQTQDAPEEAAYVVFWTNIVLGIFIYIILFNSAPLIAGFFNSPASGSVLRVLGFQIVIASVTSVQEALFIRAMDFRKLFWIRLSTAFIPGLFSIPLAIYGYGVWALVAGSLAGQTLKCFLLWRYSAWRPKFLYDMKLARKLFSFGIWVLLESFGAWLIVWGDNLIVGRFLGIHDLGVYRTGWMLVTIIYGITLNPILPIIFPTFSRLQDNMPSIKNAFYKVNRIIAALALPIGVGLLLVGPEVSNLLFGMKWKGLGFVLGILGIMNGISWLVGINAELYRAIGRPDLNSKLMFIQLLYYLPAYYIAAQYGLYQFTIIRLGVALIAIPIHIYFCVKILHVSPFYLWQNGRPMILSTFAMATGVAFLKWGGLPLLQVNNAYIALIILVSMGIIIYYGCLRLLDRSFISETIRLIKKAAFA